jgi:hypothetical protein
MRTVRYRSPIRIDHPNSPSAPNAWKGDGVINELSLAHEQLKRMRGMTRYYHDRFFSDVRAIAIAVVSLLVVGFWAVPEAFLLVPVVTVLGANQTAFDASYLYMARHYSARLEVEVNSGMRRKILVGADLEDRYLFPLAKRKIVSIGFGADFTWFGWMTIVYTFLGALAFVAGLALGWGSLVSSGVQWSAFYLASLTFLVLGSVVAGWWWFVSGVGESRLLETLDAQFGTSPESGNVYPIGR